MLLLVRNKKNAIDMFGCDNNIEYIESSIENLKYNINVDYIIHGASPTQSKFFTQNPVETLDISILGTKNVLEIAKNNSVKSMVYLSSMEMYGTMKAQNVTEEKIGEIEILNTRSSYSEGKRIAELYCYSYFSEYNVPVKMCRLAQTFGPGISKNETRVFKYFADCIINKRDIILKSTGETIINYSYTTDTILGILCILINGKEKELSSMLGSERFSDLDFTKNVYELTLVLEGHTKEGESFKITSEVLKYDEVKDEKPQEKKKKCGKKSAELIISFLAATSLMGIVLRKKK